MIFNIKGEVKEPCQKRSKTLNVESKDQDLNENEEEDGAGDDGESNVDIYQHVKEGKESDSQVKLILFYDILFQYNILLIIVL